MQVKSGGVNSIQVIPIVSTEIGKNVLKEISRTKWKMFDPLRNYVPRARPSSTCAVFRAYGCIPTSHKVLKTVVRLTPKDVLQLSSLSKNIPLLWLILCLLPIPRSRLEALNDLLLLNPRWRCLNVRKSGWFLPRNRCLCIHCESNPFACAAPYMKCVSASSIFV